MGERSQRSLYPPGSVKRRKSFFRRIAESISSFVPSSFFSGNNTTACDLDDINGSVPQYNAVYTRKHDLCSSRTCVVRDTDTQTVSVVENHNTINVDLDAVDLSEGELSAHSSTSGVSSLIPRNFASRPFGIKTKTYSMHVSDTPDGYMAHSHSATCSDGMDSIASTSTFRPPSVTPWILSQGLQSPTTIRPTKRQKISSDQSINSSYESDRMSLFYRSKTTYGGAASCRNQVRRNGLLESTTPLRFELEGSSRGSMSGSSEPAMTTNLSSTARRILESLERFTTPLATADRVPLPIGSSENVRSTPFPLKKTFRSHRFPPYMQAYKRLKNLQYEKRELFSNPQTSSIKPNPSSSTSPVPVSSSSMPYAISAASTAPVSTTWSSTSSLSVPSTSGFGFQKLPLLKKANAEEHAPLSELTAVSLDVPHNSVSLPKSSVAYTFASPIRLPPSIVTQPLKLSVNEAPKFSFSRPLRSSRSSTAMFQSSLPSSMTSHDLITSSNSNLMTITSSITTCSPIFNLITKPTTDQHSEISHSVRDPKVVLPKFDLSKSWRCETCLLENPDTKQLCSACSMPRIKQLSTPVCCDASSLTITTTNPSQLVKLSAVPSKTWECPVCMIFNDTTACKCIACGALPASKGSKSPTISEKDSAPTQLSAVSNIWEKWECPTCMVFNECDKTTCACCQTSKPCAKSQAIAAQWECPTCMVNNASDKSICPCCSTPQPGAFNNGSRSNSTPSTTINTKFAIPAVSTSPFTFGGSVPTIKLGLQPPTLSSNVSMTTSTSNLFSLPSDAKTSSVAADSSKVAEQTPTSILDIPTTSVPLVFKFGTQNIGIATTTGTYAMLGSTKPVVTSSSAAGLPFSLSQTAVNTSSGVIPPATSAPVFNFGTKQTQVSKSASDEQQPSFNAAPAFRFGFGSDSKSSCTSLTNGLVNGGSTLNLFTHPIDKKEQPLVPSAQPPCSINFSSTATIPKFDFGATKPSSTVDSTVSQPVFVFGAPFRPTSSSVAATTSSYVTPNVPGAGTVVNLGSSTSAPFLFGPAQTSLVAPPIVTSGVFCFGSNSQTAINSDGKSTTGFSNPAQPALFGQNNTASNVFSANSTPVSARKKVHATRRLHR